MFVSTGMVRYSPKTLGSRVSDKWWVIIDCDPEIGRYVRHLYFMHRNRCDRLYRPAWREHITVVRDEQPPNISLWEAYEGLPVEFTWDLTVGTNGEYYWLPIQCNFALEMRAELGLTRDPFFPLHLSIGHNQST